MEKDTLVMAILKWAIVAIVVIVGIITLVMSWYSMMDLATTTFGAPTEIAVLVSLAFDGGAIALLLITVANALKGETAIAAELFSLAFITGSLYLNVTHAGIEGMGLPGMVMFGAAPVILAIVFKFLVHLLTRDKRREQNLLKERIPSAGFLAWIFKFKKSKELFLAGLENNVNKARGQLKYVPNVELEGTKVQRDSEPLKVQAEAGEPLDVPEPQFVPLEVGDRTKVQGQIEGTAGDKVKVQPTKPKVQVLESVPEWVPTEKMSPSNFVNLCLANGIDNATQAHQLALKFDSEAKYDSYKTAMNRAKKARA